MCVMKPRAVLSHMSPSHSSLSECFHNWTRRRAQTKTIKTIKNEQNEQNETIPKKEEEQEDYHCSFWHFGGSYTDSLRALQPRGNIFPVPHLH